MAFNSRQVPRPLSQSAGNRSPVTLLNLLAGLTNARRTPKFQITVFCQQYIECRELGGVDVLSISELEAVSRRVRRLVVDTVYGAGAGHIGGPLSAVDILTVLYHHEMRISVSDPEWPDRDRFILSKGHSSPALYSVLASCGFIPEEELWTFDQVGSRLQAHPDMRKTPGVDMSTGSLGQGLSAGAGMALAAKLASQPFRVYVLLGDGECQEGQVWEAAMFAQRFALDNLVAVVDWNGLQQVGWDLSDQPSREDTLPTAVEKWRAFGWHAAVVDGHDIGALVNAFDAARKVTGQPCVILAATTKGKGISFMENDNAWHSRIITEDDYAAICAELAP